MLLTIDVGNTQTHVGAFRGDELVEHWRLATDRQATADVLATVLANLLSLRNLELRDVDAAIASSVVPELGHQYEELSDRYLDGTLMLVGPGVKVGMPIRMDNPHEVGADRIVNAVAAFERCHGACIVRRLRNLDQLRRRLERRGVPRRSDRARRRDLDRGPRVPGGASLQGRPRAAGPGDRQEHNRRPCSRASSTASRARWTPSSAACARSSATEAPAFATGGLAAPIVPFCEQIDELDDLLTLTGLRLIWERNRS